MTRVPTTTDSVSHFLQAASSHPVGNAARNRLIIGMDATASRGHTWDLATSLHGKLFRTAQENELAVQLAYYRGLGDFYASNWLSSPKQLVSHMEQVTCRGGATQILRLLRHIRREASHKALRAAVFVGDCCEEPPEEIVSAAAELALFRVPLFVFQEGRDPAARQVLSAMARSSGGAYAPFSRNSAQELADLLGAAAAYATSGSSAIREITSKTGANLLTQLET